MRLYRLRAWRKQGAATAPEKRKLGRTRRFLSNLLQGSLAITAVMVGGFAVLYLTVEIPAANGAAVAQRNVYLYADGTPLATEGSVNRESVTLSKVPPQVRNAVLAAEDRQFYHEGALNVTAALRAAYQTLAGNGRQAGSTITQQYIKNYYLNQGQTFSRKVKESIIAVKVDRRMSKDNILEGYLNTSYFGRNAYGIEAAAQAYYGKNVGSLNTAEGAYLAALLKAPSVYDIGAYPSNKGRVEARWRHVLDAMVAEKWLTPSHRAALRFPPLRPAHAAVTLSGQRGYVVQAVKQYLLSKSILDKQSLVSGGFTITTTIDRGRETALAQAVKRQLLSQLRTDRKQDTLVTAAAASVDPQTGRTLALYGGIDAAKQYINGATLRGYQVGSTFKPFILAAALANGSRTRSGELITPDTLYDGTSRRPIQGLPFGSAYAPANEDNRDFGVINVITAMERSVNSVFAQMAMDVAPETVRNTALALGMPDDVLPADVGPSIGLGAVQASPLDLAQAYATLANHGAHRPYTLVDSITKGGLSVGLPRDNAVQVISRQAADTTTHVLQGVIDRGTGTAARALGRPAAGKTGTAEEDYAAWFAGYTPDLASVIAVLGRDPATGAPSPLYGALGERRVNGGDAPARIWTDYTRTALRRNPIKTFDLHLMSNGDEGPDIGFQR
ncbi:transglycosylase domain-containing protein [Streptomyces sp. 1222.5]|uniref:transglycosylase domain-containing protein n=1 Tax=Streptomyces sp. 1222.5 TaxID=1881026 RepID=UPI003EBB1099